MFLDEVILKVNAGKGGDGMVAFRREKYVPLGGPAGGNGGRGGSVILVGEEGLNTLTKFKYLRHLKAGNGENGRSKNQHGKGADNSYFPVPLGTVVRTTDGAYIGEITKHQEELIVAHGGRGGRGNTSFKSNKNQAPNFAEKGLPGEARELKLELKMMADVGLIGFPNAGKSTIISVISNAKPKIADYPFTTLNPNLGVVVHHDQDFVVADLPGLIENASIGQGLGFQFLRHIERCRVFLHVVDVSEENPLQQYNIINNELSKYNEELLERPQLVVLNKIDLVDQETLNNVISKFPTNTQTISAVTRLNINEMLDQLLQLVNTAPEVKTKEETYYYEQEQQEHLLFDVSFDGESYLLTGDVVERLFYRTDFSNEASVKRFAYQLHHMGVHHKLRERGVKNGDTVKILGFEFEFQD